MDNDVEGLRSRLVRRLSSKIAARTQTATTQQPRSASTSSAANSKKRPRPRRRSTHHAYRHRIIQVVVDALLNPIYIDWDIKKYAAASNSSRSRKFPQLSIGTFSKPATVVDINGIIGMWYLPGLLPTKLHHQASAATLGINRLLSSSVNPRKCKTNKSWRTNKAFVVPRSNSRIISGGAVNFSGGWFAQGHTRSSDKVSPSLNLRTQIESQLWLKDIKDVEEYLNAVLSITHPHMFNAAKKVLHQVRGMEQDKEIMALWSSVFTGIAVIANRVTPSHRDRGGYPAGYDMLLNIGSFKAASFQLPDLGATFSYPPGTVINLCGNILRHQVGGWGAGDRVCYAHFMRKAVFGRFGADDIDWVQQMDYQGLRSFLNPQV